MKKVLSLFVLCMTAFMLTACGGNSKNDETAAQASEEKADAYRVLTVDESGEAVPGVMIQFCSEQLCQMGETDEDGVAVFGDQPEGKAYTIHVFSVPDGYADDETEYDVPETYGDITITIKTAA